MFELRVQTVELRGSKLLQVIPEKQIDSNQNVGCLS